MTRVAHTREINYPESDGRPMGETDLHRWWMAHIYDLLKFRYREQLVYVGSDLLLYYVEGDPRKFVVPDDFVVLDSKPEFRRKELFLYDPTLDYLNPALQGYRLRDGRYEPASSRGGALECLELGLLLSLDRERLVIQDAGTGQPLLTEAETLERELEASRNEIKELRLKLLEAENSRLRAQLLKQPGEASQELGNA
jgi:hypothetical protein